jgi:hypothetical protein
MGASKDVAGISGIAASRTGSEEGFWTIAGRLASPSCSVQQGAEVICAVGASSVRLISIGIDIDAASIPWQHPMLSGHEVFDGSTWQRNAAKACGASRDSIKARAANWKRRFIALPMILPEMAKHVNKAFWG